MKRNLWTAGLTAALSAGILFMQPVSAEAGILPEGFSVAGAGDEALDFSGQTAEEASGKLEEYVGSMAEEEISISIDGTSFSSTAGDLGLYWENEEELNAAIGEYSGGNLLERFARTKKLEKEPLSLTVKASLDDEKLSALRAGGEGRVYFQRKRGFCNYRRGDWPGSRFRCYPGGS